MNCLCPPPDYINVPGEHGFTDTVLLKGYKFLYGKKADRECENCGTPLCADCATVIEQEVEAQFYKGLMVIANQVVCPSCAEVR